MAGCYGNSFEDRYYERMLDRYLDEQEEAPEEDCFSWEMDEEDPDLQEGWDDE